MKRVLAALIVTACASPAPGPRAEATPPAVVDPPAAPSAPLLAPVAPLVAPVAPLAPPAPSGPIAPSGPFDRELHPLSPDRLDCIEMVSSCNAAGRCTSMPVYIACGATARVGTETLGCVCP